MRPITRAGRVALFDRKAITELFFDSDATADGVLLVGGISAITYFYLVVRFGLGAFSVTGLLQAVIGGLIAWLILSAGTWVAATKLFDGHGQIQTMMRLHGHAELPLVLTVLGPVGAVVGLVWSLAAKIPATREAASVDLTKSVAALLIGLALVVIVRMIFGIPFMVLSTFL